MGLRGPAPKPTALRELEGNPSGRPLNYNEPLPPVQSIQSPPTDLTEFGRNLWTRLVPMLVRIGTATDADVGTLVRYCDFAEQYVNARNYIRQKGFTYPILEGTGEAARVKYVAQFPQVAIMRNASEHMLKIEAQFGLTPSSRSRLIANPQEDKDDDDPFDYN